MHKRITVCLLIASTAVWAVDFDVTVENTFECSYAAEILGMDYYESSSPERLIFISDADDKLYACDPDDGTLVISLDCDTSNSNSFGIARGPSYGSDTYTTDSINTNIYVYDGSWTSHPNPVGSNGRGMDYAPGSPDYVWQSYSDSSNYGCYRMSTDLSNNDYITLPGISGQISGLTWFDYGDDEGILCATYDDYNLYFFTISGTTATLEGTITTPVSSDTFYAGLTYSPTRDTVFISYGNGGNDKISELDIDEFVSVKTTSLGEIKASFK